MVVPWYCESSILQNPAIWQVSLKTTIVYKDDKYDAQALPWQHMIRFRRSRSLHPGGGKQNQPHRR